MTKLGFDVNSEQFKVPFAPKPSDPNGYSSVGVYGNFLSHLGILKDIRENQYDQALILEDDAIFRRFAENPTDQQKIIDAVNQREWSMWFLGHALGNRLPQEEGLVVPTTAGFDWAHCYSVSKRGVSDLIDFLELTMSRPAGHPDGGKMYIDGAFSWFRARCTDHVCLVSKPNLSIQKGSFSNLASIEGLSDRGIIGKAKDLARYARDQFWSVTGIDFRAYPVRDPIPGVGTDKSSQ